MSIIKGVLHLVATPIGNRGDITLRALDVLRSVDQIAAEDTRHSRKLLASFDISTPLVSLHEYNEQEYSQRLISALEKGKNVALISDAGTPLISDPGYRLVKGAHDAGIRVVPVPGPSALICALSAAGLPTDRFVFEGFIASKRAARREHLTALKDEHRTIIFYESCHRILDTLHDIIDCLGSERVVVLARELTKIFETIRMGTAVELLQYLNADTNHQKGEFVVLIHGAVEHTTQQDFDDARRILEVLLDELSVKQAASLAARITGHKRNHLYDMALAISKSGES